MAGCPVCGFEYEGSFNFCPECGSRSNVPARPAGEERKIVTSLFCDLVGFTATSESADPEDVERMLQTYFALARAQIEGHGGVVEKFIGDAVFGIFGVPAAHEDDPERAVRAGLRIAEEAQRLPGVGGAPLRLRVGVNTGEAFTRLGVAPSSGEGFVTGDAVNTAARLQSLAPVMGVAVGLSTYEATACVFDYEELEPAMLKGKAEPVRVFYAKAPVSKVGVGLTRTHNSPFVGREIDLSLLSALFDKTVSSSSAQLVTVVGEPGIGKSRIVAELLAHAQERAPLLTWRQGRRLPYGDAVTFWALGEIIKTHAGILETDDAEAASDKLGGALPDGPDREWMRQRLLPLVGVDVSSPAEREELFAAWRGFLETVAEETPTVLVFEDIHWADDAMLAFIEHLADRVEGVALLVVCTARPELFERTTAFAAGLHNINRVNLGPLSNDETSGLVSELLEVSEVPPELRSQILGRAEGNPLYVEEFVRLLKDQGLVVEREGTWALREGAELPLPGSIKALIAARLDTLSPDRKAMLADAAVVGKVFWAGAVAEMGHREHVDVVDALRELSRKQLVRPARRSSMAGEVEYAFWHALACDVAYAQLPRASRASRHVAAARWLEAKAGERVEDIADVLAHHYAAALELARAGRSEQAAELEAPTLRFLTLAGERASNLDIATSRSLLLQALELAPQGHPGRARTLALLARAERMSNNVTVAIGLFAEAVAAHEAAGDRVGADDAMLRMSAAAGYGGDHARAESLIDQVIARLEAEGPSELLARAYTAKQFRHQNDLSWSDRALAIAEQLDLRQVRVIALHTRGLSRGNRGDPAGIDDLRMALALALQEQVTGEASTIYTNLAICLYGEDLQAALDVAEAGMAFESSRGFPFGDSRVSRHSALLRLGRWDEVMSEGTELLRLAEQLGSRWAADNAVGTMAVVLTRRGMVEAAAEFAPAGELWVDRPFYLARIFGHRTRGELEEAEHLLEEVVKRAVAEGCESGNYDEVCDLARETVALGRHDLLAQMISVPTGEMAADRHTRATLPALAAETDGRHAEALAAFEDAERGWKEFGDPYERAHALGGQARCLLALGRTGDAVQPLREARDLFAGLGATPALDETDALLSQATAAG